MEEKKRKEAVSSSLCSLREAVLEQLRQELEAMKCENEMLRNKIAEMNIGQSHDNDVTLPAGDVILSDSITDCMSTMNLEISTN